MRHTLAAVLLSVMLFTASGCGPDIRKTTRFMMDTYVTIQAPAGKKAQAAAARALDRMEEIDRKFSMKDPSSEIFRFNTEGRPVTDPEIIRIIRRALRVSELSSGKFDITVYPLMKLWGFYDEKRLPSKEEIRAVLKDVGYRNLVIKDGKLTSLRKGTAIDIGGIAKLYALEEGARVLKESGVTSALMDAGGDIYAIGKLAGSEWKVGIRNPRGDGIIGALDVSDMLVVSSGDYERYFEKDGIRYHHLMDPHTGYPARGLSSVTILCSDPEAADGLSAAIFVMGREKGLELAKKLGNIEVIFVDEAGEISYSEGLAQSTVIKSGMKSGK